MKETGLSKFSEADRQILKGKVCRLTEAAINDLEHCLFLEYRIRDQYPDAPPIKLQREEVRHLTSSISDLLGRLRKLDPFLERDLQYRGWFNKESLIDQLDTCLKVLRNKPVPTGKAGNKERDNQWLVDTVVSVLLRHEIIPSKRGNRFAVIFGLASDAVGIEGNTQAAIEKNWPLIEQRIFDKKHRIQSNQD